MAYGHKIKIQSKTNSKTNFNHEALGRYEVDVQEQTYYNMFGETGKSFVDYKVGEIKFYGDDGTVTPTGIKSKYPSSRDPNGKRVRSMLAKRLSRLESQRATKGQRLEVAERENSLRR